MRKGKVKRLAIVAALNMAVSETRQLTRALEQLRREKEWLVKNVGGMTYYGDSFTPPDHPFCEWDEAATLEGLSRQEQKLFMPKIAKFWHEEWARDDPEGAELENRKNRELFDLWFGKRHVRKTPKMPGRGTRAMIRGAFRRASRRCVETWRAVARLRREKEWLVRQARTFTYDGVPVGPPGFLFSSWGEAARLATLPEDGKDVAFFPLSEGCR